MPDGIRRAMAAIARKARFKLRHRLDRAVREMYDSGGWRFDHEDRSARLNAYEVVKPVVAGAVVVVIVQYLSAHFVAYIEVQ